MINKINFTGNVTIASNAKNITSKDEAKLQNYADTHDMDIIVYDKSYYIDRTNYSILASDKTKDWCETINSEDSAV